MFLNLVLALYLNNIVAKNEVDCEGGSRIFQFNLKFHEDKNKLMQLVLHLKAQNYHLITLQGVSLNAKPFLIRELNPYFPFFVNSNNKEFGVHSDQLLFSRYAFQQVKLYRSGQSASLIASHWQLPEREVNLLTLHPPSPRTQALWQARNKSLYQIEHALTISPVKQAIVIGDLNLSKHSKRIESLIENMETVFVNSWPKMFVNIPEIGLAIDHLWVSNNAKICLRERVAQFSWSDHYAIKTLVDFPLNGDIEQGGIR